MNKRCKEDSGRIVAVRQKESAFARGLLAEWRRLDLLLNEGRVVAAVSGGADSAALLLGLDELKRAGRLKNDLVVAHLEHGLRGEAGREDARWVEELAGRLGYDFVIGRARVKERARAERDNLEQAARRARYEFLFEAARERDTQLVLTAHTADDQAETVMLRLLRGSGAEGLGGIEPVREFEKGSGVRLARPLLNWARRSETEEYCRARGVEFRVDEMNEDEAFARVRVRKRLIPLMESFNVRVVQTLSRTAQLLREDAGVLNAAALKLIEKAEAVDEEGTEMPALSVNVLARAPSAIRRRALRLWIERGRGDLRRVEMVHLLAVEKLLEGTKGGRIVELPGGARVVRRKAWLKFSAEKVEKSS